MSTSKKIPAINTTCPSCKKENTLRGRSNTLAITCAHCNTYFNLGHWNELTKKFDSKYKPVIPIGSKGKFDGEIYEVMGFVIKKENKYAYNWTEYMLFNPKLGYAFLSEYDGHWNFIWPIESDPLANTSSSSFDFEDHKFELFQKYKAHVIYAEGEFFFDVVGLTEDTQNWEYISPPYVLGLEISDDSRLWYKGEYIARKEIAEAFSISDKNLPSKSGVGYTQPFSKSYDQESVIRVSLFAAALVVIAQIFFSSIAADKTIFTSSFNKSDVDSANQVIVTKSFDLDGFSKNTVIKLYSNLENDWFYSEFSLINDEEGIEYNFTKELEYYHGWEGGDSWSEGSRVGEAFLSSIPSGKYHINIYPQFGSLTNSFSIEVIRDIPYLSNMFVTLLALAIFPIFYFAQKHYFERRRWSESDYSPYDTED